MLILSPTIIATSPLTASKVRREVTHEFEQIKNQLLMDCRRLAPSQ
jgi:hypothetical protein